MGKRPIIGVTPCYDYDKGMTYITRGYMEGIMEAGGLAVLLPMTTDEEILAELASGCDGFLISGGPDVDAMHFGEQNLSFTGDISPYRDYMEIFMVKKAVESDKPVLGICRGIQVMNVALGGTLYQDMGSQIKGRALLKHTQEAPKWHPVHEVYLDGNSFIGKIFGKSVIRVNSFHHQAIKDLAPGFLATSRAADGVIESIEHKTHRFAVGVQWHPELMWQKDRLHLRIFEEFVKAMV